MNDLHGKSISEIEKQNLRIALDGKVTDQWGNPVQTIYGDTYKADYGGVTQVPPNPPK